MAGDPNRIFNFCNRQPEPCKCLNTCPNPPPNTKIEDYLVTNNAASGAPFSACNYGNAFTGVETFAGEGYGRVNPDTPVNKNMYFRYASMTKSLGITCLAAALEDGYITSIDEPISKYITEFDTNIEYATGYARDNTGTGFDSYGTPKYTLTTATYDLNLMTIRHLVTASAGFGYSFLGTGVLRSVLNSIPNPGDTTSAICNKNTFIAWLQLVETMYPNGGADTIASFYNNPNDAEFTETFTESILSRIANIPLLFIPGTQTLYDVSTTIMGAVVGGALQQQGQNITSAQYLQSRILSPLGIKNMWFNCGASQPPSNAQSNITDAYFVRNDAFIGSTDPAAPGPNPYVNTNGKGTTVVENTMYRCFDSAANGDGFTNQADNAYFQNSVGVTGGDGLAGGYDWSGCGTLPDFCKLLKFFIRKGKNASGRQILKTQTVDWILTPKTEVGQAMWLFGNDTANFMDPGAVWCGGFAKFVKNPPFPCSENTYYWQCYYGMHYYFDTDTGNYMVGGTQVPVCSWYVQTPNQNTYPYGTGKIPSYEPNSIVLWNLSINQ